MTGGLDRLARLLFAVIKVAPYIEITSKIPKPWTEKAREENLFSQSQKYLIEDN